MDPAAGSRTFRTDAGGVKTPLEEGLCVRRFSSIVGSDVIDGRLRWWNRHRLARSDWDDAGDVHDHCLWSLWNFATLDSGDIDGAVRILFLVAGHHVLGYALQAEDRVRDQGRAPELVVVFAQVVGSKDGAGALGRCNRISATDCRVGPVEVSGLDFHVADALFPGKPVLPGE